MDASVQLPEQDGRVESADITEAYIESGIEQLEAHANNVGQLVSTEPIPAPERAVPQIARELQTITNYVNDLRSRHL